VLAAAMLLPVQSALAFTDQVDLVCPTPMSYYDEVDNLVAVELKSQGPIQIGDVTPPGRFDVQSAADGEVYSVTQQKVLRVYKFQRGVRRPHHGETLTIVFSTSCYHCDASDRPAVSEAAATDLLVLGTVSDFERRVAEDSTKPWIDRHVKLVNAETVHFYKLLSKRIGHPVYLAGQGCGTPPVDKFGFNAEFAARYK
jgi:hypothetical protein